MSVLTNLFANPSRVPFLEKWEEQIRVLDDAGYLIVPLEYPGQVFYRPLVKKGDVLRMHQVIGRSDRGNCVHSPIPGKISDIKTIWTAKGYHVPAVFIKHEGENGQPMDASAIAEQVDVDWSSADALTKLRTMGVICPWTLPGRGFQEKDESYPEIRQIVIKGINEEPTIGTFEVLLREYPERIKEGLKLLAQLAPGARLHLTVSEDFMPLAVENFGGTVSVHAVSRQYAKRIEQLVVNRATGIDIPTTHAFREDGVAVVSVEYLLRMVDAMDGIPFTRKYCTVCNDCGKDIVPAVVSFPVGMPVRHILDHFGWKRPQYDRVVVGGPMRGRSQYAELTPLTKSSHGLLLTHDRPETEEVVTCTNCGRCVKVCPVNLQINLIGRYVEYGLMSDAQEYHPEACLECGLCAYVCPAGRPLVQFIHLCNDHGGDTDVEYSEETQCSVQSPLAQWEVDHEIPVDLDSSVASGGDR